MKVIFKNLIYKVEKISVYCKAGPYEHKWRVGWGLVDKDGDTFMGDENEAKGVSSSYAYYYPVYQTRKALLEDLKLHDKNWSKLK